MTALSDFENAVAALIEERTGEAWPMLAFVFYAITTDPDTGLMEEPFWFTADGQRDFITRGLLEQARDELTADVVGSFSYVETEEDDDDD